MSTGSRDRDAFEALFTAYFDPLCRFVRSYVDSWESAQDIVGDVFLKLWVRFEHLHGDREIKAYLFATARNQAISHLRHRRVEVGHREHAMLSYGPQEGTPVTMIDHELLTAELTATLQRAVDTLPTRQREIVLLKWERHATRDEIARALGIAPKTVAEHFRRALDRLRTLLPRDVASGVTGYD